MDKASGAWVVGVDAAAAKRKTGIALGHIEGDTVKVVTVRKMRSMEDAVETVAEWVEQGACLICIDAPLGWPLALGRELSQHDAGQEIDVGNHDLFRRRTDLHIKRLTKKTPLDVGADRIARTAHASLRFLGRLRARLGMALPLPIEAGPVSEPSAIEVYPGGTLAALGVAYRPYKRPEQGPSRTALRQLLAETHGLAVCKPEDAEAMDASDDLLDAAICLLAGAAFLAGDVHGPEPEERTLARREGWIWVPRSPCS
jgi:hypothetical protein